MWQRVTREQLYEQVWSVPIWTLCEQYGLSDNGLRKVCRRLNVPVPKGGERGGFHWLTECQAVRANAGTLTCRPVLSGAGTAQRNGWARVEAGKKVRKAALPTEAMLTATDIWCEPKREKTPADQADVEWLKEREAFEADPDNRVEFVEKPRRWHAAITPLRASLEEEAKKLEVSRKAQERYDRSTDWQKQRDWASERMAWFWYERAGQLMPATHHASVVRLSLAEFRRGLAILNVVAVAAVKRGFEVALDDKKGRMVLEGNGGRLEVRMSEKTEQKTRKVKRFEAKMEDELYRVPTGVLRVYVERGYGKVWTLEENSEARLEAKLNAFFAGVWKQVKFCRQKAREEEAEARRRAVLANERAEIERREAEEAALREKERKRREAFIEEVASWRRANEIRAYVAAVRTEVKSRGALSEEFLAWEAWAIGVVAEMDPLFGRVEHGV